MTKIICDSCNLCDKCGKELDTRLAKLIENQKKLDEYIAEYDQITWERETLKKALQHYSFLLLELKPFVDCVKLPEEVREHFEKMLALCEPRSAPN